LRVIREILFFEPKPQRNQSEHALEFFRGGSRPTKAIAVVISDFPRRKRPGQPGGHAAARGSPSAGQSMMSLAVTRPCARSNRRHDVVAVQIADRSSWNCPRWAG